MATFNPKAFEKKLLAMDLSQTSVQTVSLWIIHHRQSIKEIVTVWIEMMKKAKIDRKLVLLYLANDVVQNSRKKSKDLILYFGKAFRETFSHLNDKKINSQVERVLKIWEERRVYEKEYLEKLRAVHSSGKKEKTKSSDTTAKVIEKPPEKTIKPKIPVKPLPDDFKMSAVMNMIVSMKELESELSMQDSQMASLKVDDLETVKQVKDRSGVNKFVKEFEESKEKLDTYCNKLSRCINDKRVLIDMLHHSESYYDAAYEEAKVIVHAYKTFGSRLTSMKRKVESKVKKLKVQWHEKQKEIEEQRNSKPEYELEPISDAEDPSEFQADNTDVLDMDLGSDSEVGTPEGPLYDPGSVMYDPTDAGRDYGDSSQQSAEDGENSTTKINIPNPEDVFKNIVGQNEIATSSLFKPMGIMIDGKLQTVSLSDGNMIVGSEDNKEKSVIQMNATSSMSSLSTMTGVSTTSLVATEPSGSLLNNDAVSPISEDSVTSPEGTPEGLVLEKDDPQQNSILNQSDLQQQNNIATIMTNTAPLQTVMQNNQFIGGDQYVMVGSDNWPMATSAAPLQLDQTSLGTISELPPPPMMQGLPGLQTNAHLGFDQPMPGFIGDQVNLGPSFVPVQQGGGLMDQFQMGNAGINMPQQNLQMQLQMPDSLTQISAGASTTPTQDESTEQTVRPIDILSQLLSKGRKSKKDRQPSTEKDRSHSDREHRSKDHRHRKSSRRKSSDRHHSTDHRDPSSEHSESKRSHHRRKSRGHSKEKHSSHSDDKFDSKEGSVGVYDESSLDSYLKSPKVSRLQSNESFGDGEGSKAIVERRESERERSVSRSSDLMNDALDNRPSTIFDQRRNEKAETNLSQSELALDATQQSIEPAVEVMQGLAREPNHADFARQYSSGSEVFLQQQKSFEGQISVQQNEFQLNQHNVNPPASISNTEQWTPTTSAPQKQMEFYFNSRRSPTPEMDRYQVDMSLTQPQQPQFIPQNFHQPGGTFTAVSVPQFDSQPGLLRSETNLVPQVSLEMRPSLEIRPSVPMEQGAFFQHDLSMDRPGDHGMQQQSIQMGGFEMQPLFNQQVRPERPFMPEPRMNETALSADPHGGMIQSGGDVRFRPVEPQQAANMHFDPPNNLLQRPVGPPMHPPHSPFQQDRPFFRGDGQGVHPERPYFHQSRPSMRHERPPVFNEHPPFSRGRRSPFPSNDEEFEMQNNEFKQNFQTQHLREEMKLGEAERREHLTNDPERNDDFKTGDQESLPLDGPPVHHSPRMVQDFTPHQDDGFQKGQRFANSNFIADESAADSPQNGSFQDRTDEHNDYFNKTERGSGRPRFPQPNQPMRNRFRPPGAGSAMRGPRPQRMGRPAGYMHQRQRFRPPMPRPRIPQGYMPRRPVF